MNAINKYFPDGLPHTTLVTDWHGSYFKMNVKNHQVCITHLLRNVQYLSELDNRQDWSTRIASLFREAINLCKTTNVEDIPKVSIKQRLDKLLNENAIHLHEEFQKFKKAS